MSKDTENNTRMILRIHVNSDCAQCPDGTIINYKTFYKVDDRHCKRQCKHRILLIMGFATSQERWSHVINNLFKLDQDLEICTLDNRGSGESSIPLNMELYSTEIMARDVIMVMDKIQWRCAHIAGFSLGSMIACKMVAMYPERVLTMVLLAATGGGGNQYHCL